MYNINYFKEENNQVIMEFMQANPFAIVCSNDKKFPSATHIPLEINFNENEIILTGHLMKNTDHHKAFLENENVLVIFNGPHTFVSAGWYSNPQVASTWNYMTVHAKGKLSFTDEQGTIKIIEGVTDFYEGKDNPGSFKNIPEQYVNRLSKAIIGFTIKLESLDAVFKLSQNHEIDNRKSIIAHLQKKPDDNSRLIAEEMEKRINLPKQSK